MSENANKTSSVSRISNAIPSLCASQIILLQIPGEHKLLLWTCHVQDLKAYHFLMIANLIFVLTIRPIPFFVDIHSTQGVVFFIYPTVVSCFPLFLLSRRSIKALPLILYFPNILIYLISKLLCPCTCRSLASSSLIGLFSCIIVSFIFLIPLTS